MPAGLHPGQIGSQRAGILGGEDYCAPVYWTVRESVDLYPRQWGRVWAYIQDSEDACGNVSWTAKISVCLYLGRRGRLWPVSWTAKTHE